MIVCDFNLVAHGLGMLAMKLDRLTPEVLLYRRNEGTNNRLGHALYNMGCVDVVPAADVPLGFAETRVTCSRLFLHFVFTIQFEEKYVQYNR